MKHNTVVRMVTDLGRGDIGNICSRQGHIARAEKVLPQINKGKIVTLPRKWSKDKSPQFMEEETHKINKNVKERSISLIEVNSNKNMSL